MKSCNDAIAVHVMKTNLPFDRCFKCSGVVAIKDDRAALHPAQPFYTETLVFELCPMATFKRAIFHVESRNADVCAELDALCCYTISSQRPRRFHSGGNVLHRVFTVSLCWRLGGDG